MHWIANHSSRHIISLSLLMGLIPTSSYAEENYAQSDQIGNQNNSIILQSGISNIIKGRQTGNLNSAFLLQQSGYNNKISAEQIGNHNELGQEIFEAGLIQQGSHNNVDTTQDGNTNSIHLKQIGDNNDIILHQIGNQNDISVEQLGNNYSIKINQTGNRLKYNIRQGGY